MSVLNRIAAVAGAAVLLLGFAAAQASPIKLTYLNNLTSPTGGITGHGNVRAGEFHMRIDGGETPYWDDRVNAFCVDISTTLQSSSWYDVRHGLSATTFDSDRQNKLDRLFTSYYETSTTDKIYSAAMQLAIWEIIEEDSGVLNLAYGDFQSGLFSGAREIANAWLANLGDKTGRYEFFFLESRYSNSQDLLTVRKVPEPGTLLLLGAGLAGVGLMRRRRTA